MKFVNRVICALVAIIMVSVFTGIVATVPGESLSDLGSGYGGLYGLPIFFLTALAAVVDAAVAAASSQRFGPGSGRLRIALVIVARAWMAAIGYSIVTHAVDPCSNSWWDAAIHIGSQPRCERV